MNFGKNKITFICARIIEIASLMESLNFPFIEFGIHLIKKNKIRAQSITKVINLNYFDINYFKAKNRC